MTWTVAPGSSTWPVAPAGRGSTRTARPGPGPGSASTDRRAPRRPSAGTVVSVGRVLSVGAVVSPGPSRRGVVSPGAAGVARGRRVGRNRRVGGTGDRTGRAGGRCRGRRLGGGRGPWSSVHRSTPDRWSSDRSWSDRSRGRIRRGRGRTSPDPRWSAVRPGSVRRPAAPAGGTPRRLALMISRASSGSSIRAG